MACILLAASGLRSGELVGLEVRHFDGESLRVEQEVWRGQVLPPKTPSARRIVDLHPDVASLLKQFIGTRRSGFIFQTRTGKPMSALNLLHRGLYPALEDLGFPRCGFHAFRRYRNTFLRNLHCPDGLLKFWMGHAAADMSDRYDRVREDVQFRRDVVRSLGVGFKLPENVAAKRPKAGDLGVIGRQPEMACARNL
jgi:integrase